MILRRGGFLAFAMASSVLLLIILIKAGIAETITNKFLGNWVTPLVILFITIVIARVAKQALHVHFDKASKEAKVYDRTRYAIFGQLISLLIWAVGIGVIVSLIPQLRAASISIFAGAGVLAIIIGLAMQKTFGNLASGVFIVTFQPYRIGDKLDFMGEYGTVRDINLRHTIIETWDNRRIIVPNSKMDEEVINNYTIEDPTILGTVEVPVSYDTDIDKARALMQEEVFMHPDFHPKSAHSGEAPRKEDITVRVMGLADFSVTLRAYYWAESQPVNFRMRTDLTERIKKRFDKEGIEIPFPYRTVVYKKDLEEKSKKKVPNSKSTQKKSVRTKKKSLTKKK